MIMTYIAFLMIGIISAVKIPVSPLPMIDIPEIIVQVNKYGLTAIEVDEKITSILRIELSQISSLEEVNSISSNDNGIVRLKFKYGTDLDYAFIEVNEKLDQLVKYLPPDTERPLAIKSKVSDIPVLYVNINYNDSARLYQENFNGIAEISKLAKNNFKRRFEQMPAIALVDITGVVESEIYITPRPEATENIRLNEAHFKQILQENSLSLGNVTVRNGDLEYNLRFSGENLSEIDDIKNIKCNINGRLFKLSDIADIGVRNQRKEGLFLADAKRGISLAIIKKDEAQMSDLRNSVGSVVNELSSEYTELRFRTTQDQASILDSSISNLKLDLLFGGLLAFTLLLFFLNDRIAPVLLLIVLPVSLILCLLFFSALGITVNIVSLSGLVLGIGLMIDNAIIVIDNIAQHRLYSTLENACIDGTNDVIRPMISSMLTACSVFLPLIFISGIAGSLFYDQALAVVIGVNVSLIVSVTLLPTLYFLFYKRNTNDSSSTFLKKFRTTSFERIYDLGFFWVFNHKKLMAFMVILFLCLSFFTFLKLPKEKMPEIADHEMMLEIDWSQNIPLEESSRRIEQILNAIKNETSSSSCWIGEQQYLFSRESDLSASEARIYLNIKPRSGRLIIEREIQNIFKKQYPAATIKVSKSKNIFEQVFMDMEAPIVARISYVSRHSLPKSFIFDSIQNRLNFSFPYLIMQKLPMSQVLVVGIKTEKLLVNEITFDIIYSRLKYIFGINKVMQIGQGDSKMPIVLSANYKSIEDILQHATVTNSNGVSMPLYNFIEVKEDYDYKKVYADESGQYLPLEIQNLGGTPPSDIMTNIQNMISDSDSGMQVTFAGHYFSVQKLVKEMVGVMAVVFLLLYFVLAAQFESLLQPLIVLIELPISIGGAICLLYFANSSINVMSLIGIVVMSGIIINDSILKIDAINKLRRNENYSVMDAIHTGGRKRLKSIIMTSCTTILSVVPFLWGSDMGSLLQRPLSIALMGGMIVGTLVSLFIIPLVYAWCYSKVQVVNKK